MADVIVARVRLTPSGAELGTAGLQALANVVAWPFAVTRELIQIGYEPIEPRKSRDIFGKTVYRLPSGIAYARHIRATKGWRGLYRGVSARIAEGFVYTIVRNFVKRAIHKAFGWDVASNAAPWVPSTFRRFAPSDSPQATGKTLLGCFSELSVEIVSGCVAQFVAHPLHVVSCRIAAQYIGEENTYVGIAQSIRLIVRREGVQAGLFAGVVPALLGEAVETTVITCLRLISEYIFDEDSGESDSDSDDDDNDEEEEEEEEELASNRAAISQDKALVVQIGQLLLSPLFYPFWLVKTRMIIAGSGLAASLPPFMPSQGYSSWKACLSDAYTCGGWSSVGLLRGSAMFGRTLPASSLKIN